MSNYESMSGKAKLKGADFASLRRELIAALNQDIEKISAKLLKKGNIQKANTRTLVFPFVNYQAGDEDNEGFAYKEGAVVLNKEDNTLRFYTDYNNHTVDSVAETKVFNTLMRFFNKMPNKGAIYGAETAYRSEYQVDEYDNEETSYTFYGAWQEEAPTKFKRAKVR